MGREGRDTMTLTFQEYEQQALTTAVYPRQYVLLAGEKVKPNAPSCIYPVFGLCGEIGEVVDVLYNTLGQTTELYKECGDVLWYVAAICRDLNINMGDVAGFESFEEFVYHTELTNNISMAELVAELFIAAGIVAEATKKTIRDDGGVTTDKRLAVIKKALYRVLVALSAICRDRSVDFAVVPRINLDKLAARSAKGTIGGSGDNR